MPTNVELKYNFAASHIAGCNTSDVGRYVRYFNHILPTSDADRFRRWLFCYASVHTSWKMNCSLYIALQDLGWLGNKKELRQRIIDCGAGMHNKRAEYIYSFAEYFWNHTAWFNKSNYETWFQYRDRLKESAPGIGPAKAAFLVELTYPFDARVICVDTHVLQLYGFSSKDISVGHVNDKTVYAIEKHWVDTCVANKISPTIARWLFWDKKQKQNDPRYWSFVFEKENYRDRLEEPAYTGKQQVTV